MNSKPRWEFRSVQTQVMQKKCYSRKLLPCLAFKEEIVPSKWQDFMLCCIVLRMKYDPSLEKRF